MQDQQMQPHITIQPLQQQPPLQQQQQQQRQTPLRTTQPLVRVIPHRIIGSPPTTFNPHQTTNVVSKNSINSQQQLQPQIITMTSPNNNNNNDGSFILSLSNDNNRRIVTSSDNVLINNNNNNNNKLDSNDLLNLNNNNNNTINTNNILNNNNNNNIMNNGNLLNNNNLLNTNNNNNNFISINNNINNLNNSNLNNNNLNNNNNSNNIITPNNNPAHVNQQQFQHYKSFNNFDNFQYVDDTSNQIIYQTSDQMSQQNGLYTPQQTIFYSNDNGDIIDQNSYMQKQQQQPQQLSNGSSNDNNGRTFIVHRQFQEDTQLLAGGPRASPATVNWLLENYESSEGVSIPRSTNYNHYKNYILSLGMEPMNQASFGKLIRSVFPQIRTRRLGTRGNSKYHYYGIKLKPSSSLNNYDYKSNNETSFNNTQGGIYQLQQLQQSNDNQHQQQQQQHYTLSSPAIAATTGSYNNSVHQQHSVENLSIESAQLSRDFSLQQISADGIVNLPQLASIQLLPPDPLPPGITTEHFAAYKGLYIEQCEAIIASVLKFQFNLIESLWKSFWRTDNQDLTELESSLAKEALYRIAELKEVQDYTRKCDFVFYQWLIELLIPDVLKPIESHLTQMIRTFAKHLELSLRRSMVGVCESMVECKVSTVTAFSQSLRRYTSLNHLSQAARAVLQNPSQVSQMLSDLNRVDFGNIQEQASWVCRCEGEVVKRIEGQLKETLEKQSTLEEWSVWLDSVVSSVLVSPPPSPPSNHRSTHPSSFSSSHHPTHPSSPPSLSSSSLPLSTSSTVNDAGLNTTTNGKDSCGNHDTNGNHYKDNSDINSDKNNINGNNNINVINIINKSFKENFVERVNKDGREVDSVIRNNHVVTSDEMVEQLINGNGVSTTSTTAMNCQPVAEQAASVSAAMTTAAAAAATSTASSTVSAVTTTANVAGVITSDAVASMDVVEAVNDEEGGKDIVDGSSLNDIFLETFDNNNINNNNNNINIHNNNDSNNIRNCNNNFNSISNLNNHNNNNVDTDTDSFADNIKNLKNFINAQNNIDNITGNNTHDDNDADNSHTNKKIQEYTKKAHRFLLNWSFYSSMVIRDLTLRSAASFGSFHLIRLLFDEYIFYLIEKKISSMANTTCIATVVRKSPSEALESVYCNNMQLTCVTKAPDSFSSNSFFAEDIVSVAMETVGGLDHVINNQPECGNDMVECVVDCSTASNFVTKVKEESSGGVLRGSDVTVAATKQDGVYGGAGDGVINLFDAMDDKYEECNNSMVTVRPTDNQQQQQQQQQQQLTKQNSGNKVVVIVPTLQNKNHAFQVKRPKLN